MLSSSSTRYIKAGIYKRLRRNGVVVMSNTPVEIDDCIHFIHIAKGNILINGLGLGVVLRELLNKEDVKSIIVIEKSEDVIKLVVPFYKDKRLTIINADALEWKPPKGQRYDFVWHDIWDDICDDNLKEMEKLHRKYSKKTDWQDSWCKKLCKKLKRSALP